MGFSMCSEIFLKFFVFVLDFCLTVDLTHIFCVIFFISVIDTVRPLRLKR